MRLRPIKDWANAVKMDLPPLGRLARNVTGSKDGTVAVTNLMTGEKRRLQVIPQRPGRAHGTHCRLRGARFGRMFRR